MKSKAKQKRNAKSGKQDDSHSSDTVPSQAEVAKTTTTSVVKQQMCAEVSVAAVVATASGRKRKASSAGDSGSVQRQDDSETICDTVTSKKRKAAMTSSQNDELLQQEKQIHRSIDKRRPPRNKQHPTRARKSPSEVQKKKAEEQQLETAVASVERKSSKVKCKSPRVSSVTTVDKTSVKTEKLHVSSLSPPRVSLAGDSGSADRRDDSETVLDRPTVLSGKRKTTMTCSQNNERLQHEKQTCKSINRRRPSRKKQCPTRVRMSPSEVQKKEADEEQLEVALASVERKSSKVKCKSPRASSIKTIDKIPVKTEKLDVTSISPPAHSSRKFVGAHVSISGMSATCYQLCSLYFFGTVLCVLLCLHDC